MMTILRERPWLVALVALVFGVVLRMAPWPLNWIGGGILTALTIWALWAAWTHRGWFLRTFRAIRRRIIGAAVDDARIEAASAVRAAALDTVEADIQTSTTRAAWVSQIEYQQGLLDSPNHALTKTQRLASERLVRQLRRNVRDLDTAEGRPVSLATHGARPLAAFGPVAAATNPLMLWLGGGLLAFGLSGWGMAWVQGNLKEQVERQRDDAQAAAEAYGRTLIREREAREAERINATRSAEETRRLNDQLRAEARRAAARARRIDNAAEQVRSGGPAPNWDSIVRDDDPVEAGSPDSATGGANGDRPG